MNSRRKVSRFGQQEHELTQRNPGVIAGADFGKDVEWAGASDTSSRDLFRAFTCIRIAVVFLDSFRSILTVLTLSATHTSLERSQCTG